MSSAELSAPRGGTFARPRVGVRVTVPPAPAALLALLLLLSLWAAFDHGAVDEAASARLEVTGAIIALVAAVAWLWSGSLRVPRGGLPRAAVGLLAAFGVWSAVTWVWSVS